MARGGVGRGRLGVAGVLAVVATQAWDLTSCWTVSTTFRWLSSELPSRRMISVAIASTVLVGLSMAASC